MSRCTSSLIALACVAAGAFAPLPAAAGAWDGKSISPSSCQPYAPDTTSAELQVTAAGIYNPGATIEKVICPIPRDQEVEYIAGNATVLVDYRVLGTTQGRLTCTLYVGSPNHFSGYAATATTVGPLTANGNITGLQISAPTQGDYEPQAPVTLVCAISPKTWMGAIELFEYDATDAPPAA
jgi:hypothetical protein